MVWMKRHVEEGMYTLPATKISSATCSAEKEGLLKERQESIQTI